MKFGVVIFPGSNCDQDMIYVLRKIMSQKVVELWHKERNLQNCDMVILPGGFSYGDYLRSGAIARFAPIMEKVIEFANKGGYVFGVCNGFQILCEAKLIPGTLLRNTEQKFICKNVFIKAQNNNTMLTSAIPENKVLKIPIAHEEGNYFNDAKSLKKMNDNGQILFRYCDENGNITSETNPNGSIENIAGVCNTQKNVFGMMPHPERASDTELGNTDGKFLFESILSLLGE
ncbi:MAG: phosphoribosylformylglycinamidine synthase subunit PurQ [Bacteroidota bacterium]